MPPRPRLWGHPRRSPLSRVALRICSRLVHLVDGRASCRGARADLPCGTVLSLQRLASRPCHADAAARRPDGISVATLDESFAVLAPSHRGRCKCPYPHTTIVLDDGVGSGRDLRTVTGARLDYRRDRYAAKAGTGTTSRPNQRGVRGYNSTTDFIARPVFRLSSSDSASGGVGSPLWNGPAASPSRRKGGRDLAADPLEVPSGGSSFLRRSISQRFQSGYSGHGPKAFPVPRSSWCFLAGLSRLRFCWVSASCLR